MCGIFGVFISDRAHFDTTDVAGIIKNLFILSESRGKESSGIALHQGNLISVFKSAVPASRMIRHQKFKDFYRETTRGLFNNHRLNANLAIIGHSRLVTNGHQNDNRNNQPVIKDGIVGIHNGIVANAPHLWEVNQNLTRESEVDTEVMISLIRQSLKSSNSITRSITDVFEIIEGAASTALLFNDIPWAALATNTGSLYCIYDDRMFIFASEHFILESLIRLTSLDRLIDHPDIVHVEPWSGFLINLQKFDTNPFRFNGKENEFPLNRLPTPLSIKEFAPIQLSVGGARNTCINLDKNSDNLLEYNIQAIKGLKRCTKCLLPETFTFIDFDEQGICNYCRGYKKIDLLGLDRLNQDIEPYRSKKSGRPDCLVTFSGGRDSSYGLHYIKEVLKMNPIAYTYDWGMVTDLARRNQARICGKLGVEHILVSPYINKKRLNIHKNVKAWLKRPSLGTIPLFMAGDKQFFYYANKVGKQNGTDLVFLCENPFERTDFKSGFCGIRPSFGKKEHIYSLSIINKLKMISYYGKEYLLNPSYINSTILDTASAFFSYYFLEHNYINLYNYLMWDEKRNDDIILENYNWETSPDTKTTWRIGDGTAAFYNYIYHTVAGFTENDTLRSNQIREGMITRDEGLALIYEDNKPRPESIRWYLNTIDLEFSSTIKIINNIPKLYKQWQNRIY